MIVSDGYETGDAALLGREMAQLRQTLPPHRLAQSDDGLGGLRARGRRHQGGAAVCRSLRACAYAGEPRRARTVSRKTVTEGEAMTAHVDVMDIVSRLKAAERSLRAGDGRAHGFGDGRQGRRQGGDPAGWHGRGRLDRRRLRAGRGVEGRSRGAGRRRGRG